MCVLVWQELSTNTLAAGGAVDQQVQFKATNYFGEVCGLGFRV